MHWPHTSVWVCCGRYGFNNHNTFCLRMTPTSVYYTQKSFKSNINVIKSKTFVHMFSLELEWKMTWKDEQYECVLVWGAGAWGCFWQWKSFWVLELVLYFNIIMQENNLTVRSCVWVRLLGWYFIVLFFYLKFEW